MEEGGRERAMDCLSITTHPGPGMCPDQNELVPFISGTMPNPLSHPGQGAPVSFFTER